MPKKRVFADRLTFDLTDGWTLESSVHTTSDDMYFYTFRKHLKDQWWVAVLMLIGPTHQDIRYQGYYIGHGTGLGFVSSDEHDKSNYEKVTPETTVMDICRDAWIWARDLYLDPATIIRERLAAATGK